jgi:predicted N-formylglutamate amidohydrolase
LFATFTRDLSPAQKQQLISRFYTPHRSEVEGALREKLSKPESLALHVAIHSFTPVFEGKTRRADIGLLYDPGRRNERSFASEWHERLSQAAPELTIRKNYPYRGTSDGLTTSLRRTLGSRYLGFEIEINQASIARSRRAQHTTAALLSRTLAGLL